MGSRSEGVTSRKLQADNDDVQIPQVQRRPLAPTLAEIANRETDRNAAIRAAHVTGAYSYQQIADHFGMHFTSVWRIVRGKMICADDIMSLVMSGYSNQSDGIRKSQVFFLM